jgi:hypothetical protein
VLSCLRKNAPGSVEIAPGNILDQQLAANEERENIQRKIMRLGKQSRSERQPRRKLELAEEIEQLKKQRR